MDEEKILERLLKEYKPINTDDLETLISAKVLIDVENGEEEWMVTIRDQENGGKHITRLSELLEKLKRK